MKEKAEERGGEFTEILEEELGFALLLGLGLTIVELLNDLLELLLTERIANVLGELGKVRFENSAEKREKRGRRRGKGLKTWATSFSLPSSNIRWSLERRRGSFRLRGIRIQAKFKTK